MIKNGLIWLVIIILSPCVYAGEMINTSTGLSDFCVDVSDATETTKVYCPRVVKYTGVVTDNGDNTVTLTDGGGGGGGGSSTISVDSVFVALGDFQDSAELDPTNSGGTITYALVAGSIDETKLDASTNASLDLADSALQSETSHADVVVDGDIGSTVQAWDEHLDDLAGLVPGAEGKMITSDGLGTYRISTVADVRAYLNVVTGAHTVEANDLSSVVTWTNVPDANVTESSVTQHVAAIDHDATLNFVANEHIDWTGASAGTIHATNYVDNNTQLSQEQVEDFAGAMVATGGTKTGIAVTYQDATGDMDFVVDHDAATNFVANEHIDWTGASAGTIHATNYVDNDTTTNETITLSGDASGSGTSSIAVTIANDAIEESMLKAVNVAVDEDIVTYEATTGDFEYHTPSELITAGDNISWTGTTLNVSAHTTDTNANTICTGTTTYLDGEGNCDDISSVYEPAGITESDISDLDHTATAITDGLIVEADLNEDSGTPTDEDVLTYDSTGANFNWVAQSTLAAGTAAALAANGGNCSAGSYPLGVDASGAVESCTDATTEIDSAISTHAGSATAHQALVTLAGTPDYLTITGQEITRGTIDIGDDTNLTCGTNCTLTGDEISVDDSFLLNNGDIGTGTFDFGGADDLEIPNGTAPTVDTAGQVALDTTANDFLYYGSAVHVLTPELSSNITIESPDDADNILWFKAPYALTITDIECVVDPADTGESVVITIQERDGNGDSPAGVDGATTITCGNTTTSDDGTLSNGTIDTDDYVSIDVGTVTGTVTQLSVRLKFTKDRE